MANKQKEVCIGDTSNWWNAISLSQIVEFYKNHALRKELTMVDWALDVGPNGPRILFHLFDFRKNQDNG